MLEMTYCTHPSRSPLKLPLWPMSLKNYAWSYPEHANSGAISRFSESRVHRITTCNHLPAVAGNGESMTQAFKLILAQLG
jgi:hypothetical protein